MKDFSRSHCWIYWVHEKYHNHYFSGRWILDAPYPSSFVMNNAFMEWYPDDTTSAGW